MLYTSLIQKYSMIRIFVKTYAHKHKQHNFLHLNILEMILVFTWYLSGAGRGHDIERCWEAITDVLMTQQPDQRIFSSSLSGWMGPDRGCGNGKDSRNVQCWLWTAAASGNISTWDWERKLVPSHKWELATNSTYLGLPVFICHQQENFKQRFFWFYFYSCF